MASEQAKPIKGILKNSTSFEKADSSDRNRRDMKWDEMNILATYHPEGKEYGHMKIDEPPTPYAEMEEEEEEQEGEDHKKDAVVDPDALAKILQSTSKDKPKPPPEEEESSEEEELPLTDEEKEKRRQFELKRKLHYNEFMAVKLGRQLIDEEDDDDDDDDEEKKEEPKEKQGKTQTQQAEPVDSSTSIQSEETAS